MFRRQAGSHIYEVIDTNQLSNRVVPALSERHPSIFRSELSGLFNDQGSRIRSPYRSREVLSGPAAEESVCGWDGGHRILKEQELDDLPFSIFRENYETIRPKNGRR
jgi:hypothetical protein